MSNEEKLTERIRALLAKAEGTDNEHEAEVFMSKAEALMSKHMIDEVMLRAAAPRTARSTPVARRWNVPNPYAYQKRSLLFGLGRAFGCKGVQWTSRWSEDRVELVGFPEDLDVIDALFTSLCAQMARHIIRVKVPEGLEHTVWRDCYTDRKVDEYARNAYATREPVPTRTYRVDWADGYVSRLIRRVDDHYRAAVTEADDAGGSVALAVRDRKQEIADEYARLHPRVGTGRSRHRSHGAGWNAGKDAAGRADIGQGRVGHSRRELN